MEVAMNMTGLDVIKIECVYRGKSFKEMKHAAGMKVGATKSKGSDSLSPIKHLSPRLTPVHPGSEDN